MCGEYGEQFGRPHFHACIFGYNFPDKKLWKTIRGNKLYTSEFLSDTWGKGFVTIGSLTFESAAYVARYIMKKVTGDAAESHYEYLTDDGEYIQRTPEFTKMSLKPGIAHNWYVKFKDDVYPNDAVAIRRADDSIKLVKPPKYYDRKYEIEYPSDMEEIKYNRYLQSKKHSANNTPDRLAVREAVQMAKINQLKRTLK